MKKGIGHISAIIGRILFIGFSVQILLGMFWMCCNIGTMQGFRESLLCLSENGGFLDEKYLWCVQAVWLTVAFVSAYVLVSSVRGCGLKEKVWTNVWGSLVILTIPTSMQCHLTPGAESPAGSLFLLEIAMFLRGMRTGKRTEIAKASAFWLLSFLLEGKYLLVGVLPIAVMVFVLLRKHKMTYRLVGMGLLIAVFFGGAGLQETLYAKENPEGMEYDLSYRLSSSFFSRTAWSTVIRDWELWPDVLWENVEGDVLISASYYADNMEDELKPVIVDKLGVEGAKALYLQVSKEALKAFPGQILKETAWDAIGYSVPPVGARLFLEGRGYDSYTVRNYDFMRRHTPVLTRYYMDYGCQWFGWALVLAVVYSVLGLAASGRKIPKIPATLVTIIISCIILVGYHSLRGAGIYDYKQTIAISSLWVAFILQGGYYNGKKVRFWCNAPAHHGRK